MPFCMNIDHLTFESVSFLQGFLFIFFLWFFLYGLFSTRLSYHNKHSPRFSPWRRQHRGSGGRRRVPTGIRRRNEPRGKKTRRSRVRGRARWYNERNQHGYKVFLSWPRRRHALARNPISKQLHRKKRRLWNLRMQYCNVVSDGSLQYCNVPECSCTTVKYCTSQFTTFLCARSNNSATVQSIQNIKI